MEHGLELTIARLEILEIEVFNIIHNPGNIGNWILLIFPYPGNIGNWIFLIAWYPGNTGNRFFLFSYILDAWKYWKFIVFHFPDILEILEI